jgi:DNA-binding NtrC family response regulator
MRGRHKMKEKFEALVEHLVGHGFFLEEVVELLERTLIERTLERTGGNRSAASKLLGIHRNTLQRKMAEYKLGTQKARRKPVRAESRARRKALTA